MFYCFRTILSIVLYYSLKYLGLVIFIFCYHTVPGLIITDSKVYLAFKLKDSLQNETKVHLVNDQLSILEYYCGCNRP